MADMAQREEGRSATLDRVSGQLILIRHAKAEVGAVDRDRPLSARGQSDAAAVGRLLAQTGIVPDLAVVSPARRARQTWDGVQAGLADQVEVVIDERIYDNEVAALLQVVHEVAAETRCLAMVGHNPSFAEFANVLDDGQGDPEARDRLRAGYPTSGMAIFDVTGGWDELAPHSATLQSFAVGRGRA
jgi:phosphohistidine phosphatase